MQYRVEPACTRLARFIQDLLDFHEFRGGKASCVTRGLVAVTAVLRTTSGLDAQELALLNCIGLEVTAMRQYEP